MIGKTEIIDDQTAGLVFEHTVDTGNGLHQTVPLHGLVNVHGMKGGTSKPVSHISRTMTILNGSSGVFEAFGKFFTPALVRMCCCHSSGSEATARHDDLDDALFIISECHSGRSLMMAL